ncbi:MAG: 3-keto-5-aminohexanoate cleavage protein [Firmicutes bacterium]|jgi:uncharacterized protein (DUF849 family)|nr:3-keto-5-aminohexanoate cleavage protein [Bacillota bacterium]
MNYEVVLTCAVTGSGDSHLKHPGVPKTPEEIAKAAIEAAKAGAAIAHVHVRDPKTGDPCREMELYEETAKLIRESGTDVILNLTTGMGGDFVPDEEDPSKGGPGTDMITAAERVAHIERIKPEICTLDCGSFNYQATAYLATYEMLRESARRITAAGVRAELEVFELGHIWQAKDLIKEGLLDEKSLFQFCMGIPYGAEATTQNMVAMLAALPKDAMWGAFGIGRQEMPMVAQSVFMGGNARVGLEDNIYLGKGNFASNEDLVRNAVEIIEKMGGRVLSPEESRKKLQLNK